MKNKKVTYKIINEYNVKEDLSKEEFKLLFNKKLLKVIISTEKNIYGRCKS